MITAVEPGRPHGSPAGGIVRAGACQTTVLGLPRALRWPRACSRRRMDKTGTTRQRAATRRPYKDEATRGRLRRRERSAAYSASRVANGASSISRRGTMTTSRPPMSFRRLNSSRARRFARLRSTADPSFLVAATPSRGVAPPLTMTKSVMCRPWTFAPPA